MTIDTQERAEVATKSPTKWRNWWHTANGINTQRNGRVEPGTDFPGSMEFWSREDAEEQARKDMARDVFYVLSEGVKYLGAYSEGEKP